MTPLADTCRTVLRQQGPLGLAATALDRLRRRAWVHNAADWYLADLTPPPGSPPPNLPDASTPGTAVAFDATNDVIRWLYELRGEFRWACDEHELEAARRYGHAFGLLTIDGQRAGYIKVGFERAYVGDFGRCIRIPPDTAFVYDTFVHPAFRGRGAAGVLIRQTLCFCRARSRRWLWCHIPRWNTPSIRAFTRQGFRPVRHIRHVRLCGVPLYTLRPEALLARPTGFSPAEVVVGGETAIP